MNNLGVQCRLCAEFKQEDNVLNIKDEKSTISALEQKIALCLDINFLDTTLPSHVCHTCFERVTDSYEFREQVRKCQIYLIPLEEEVLDNVNIFETKCEDVSEVDLKECLTQDDFDIKFDSDETESEDEKDQEFEEDQKADPPQTDEENIPLSKFEKKNKRRKLRIDAGDVKNNIVKRKYVRTGKYSKKKKKRTLVSDPERAKLAEERSLLIKKVQEEWKAYKWICATCKIELSSLEILRDHSFKEHNEACKYVCMECPKIYENYNNFKRHVAVHRNRFKYRCDVCNQFFARRRNYRYHLETHSLVKNYMCAECGKHYKTVSTLQSHLRTHVKRPPTVKYECDICQKKLASKKGLNHHKKTHDGHRDFTCELCGRSFMSAGSLKYHMQSAHSDERPYCCSHCQRTFKHRDLLNVHLQVHSDQRPHACDVCGKRFHRKSTLNRHVSVHTGILAYECDYCKKKFRTKESLRVHVRQHTGERPYACLECNHFFSDSGNYVKHMKGKHGVLTTRKDVTYRIDPQQIINNSAPPIDPPIYKAELLIIDPIIKNMPPSPVKIENQLL